MVMQSHLTFLDLPRKQKLSIQIGATALIIYAGYAAYQNVTPMLNNMHTISANPDMRLPELKTWFFFLILILGIVPGVYIFLELKRHFKKTDQTCF